MTAIQRHARDTPDRPADHEFSILSARCRGTARLLNVGRNLPGFSTTNACEALLPLRWMLDYGGVPDGNFSENGHLSNRGFQDRTLRQLRRLKFTG